MMSTKDCQCTRCQIDRGRIDGTLRGVSVNPPPPPNPDNAHTKEDRARVIAALSARWEARRHLTLGQVVMTLRRENGLKKMVAEIEDYVLLPEARPKPPTKVELPPGEWRVATCVYDTNGPDWGATLMNAGGETVCISGRGEYPSWLRIGAKL